MAMLHRQVGKFKTRSADDVSVALLITEVDIFDKRLDKLIDGLKHWKDAISNLLHHQKNISSHVKELYLPIPGGTIDRDPADDAALEKVIDWDDTTSEMKTELTNEMQAMDDYLVHIGHIKTSLVPVKKAIKRREDKKLDYERFKNSSDSARKKVNKSDKDQANQVKIEASLARATSEYQSVDDALKEWIPGVLAKVTEFIPYIFYAINHCQYTFLSHSYTITFQYAEKYGLQVDTPDVHREWREKYTPTKDYVESEFRMLREGKAIHQPMEIQTPESIISRPTKFFRKSSSGSHMPPSPSRPTSTHNEQQEEEDAPPIPTARPGSRRTLSVSSSQSYLSPSTNNSAPSDLRKIRSTSTSNLTIHENNGVLKKQPSNSSWRASNPPVSLKPSFIATSPQPTLQQPSYTAIAAKKKPPPPPPPKSRALRKLDEYVVAVYEFQGQNDGDLSFREGDRIKIIQKTPNTDEWWEGELNGRKGAFPANYCQPG